MGTKRICKIHNHILDVRTLDYSKGNDRPTITYSCNECRSLLLKEHRKLKALKNTIIRRGYYAKILRIKNYKQYWKTKHEEVKNVLSNKN